MRTMRVKLSLLALLLACLPLQAQDTTQTAGTATVYFYRLRDMYASFLKPSVFCDKNQVARMRNGRFVKYTVAAGEHTITSTFAGNGSQLELKAGETYYFRVEMTRPTWAHNARGQVTKVDADQGKFEVASLKAADPEDLKADGTAD
jgi:hypothetical protein